MNIPNTTIANSLSITLNTQNNYVSNLDRFWDLTLFITEERPNRPVINSDIRFSPWDNYDIDYPLSVYFNVGTKIENTSYTIKTGSDLFVLFATLGSTITLIMVTL